MRLKHYIAESLPDAIHKVRQDLGTDAIILATDELGPGKGVRVTAGLDEEAEQEFSIQDPVDDVDIVDEITEVLDFHRLPSQLIETLVGHAIGIPASEWHISLAGALDNHFRFATIPNRPQPRPLMLVGMPGDGKTSTIAKLCAKARLSDVPTSVITIDSEKTGGIEQIATFCHRLQVNLEIAETPERLSEIVDRTSTDRLILIDTMGINPFDDASLNELSQYAFAANAEIALVTPAGGDVYETADKAAAFSIMNSKYIIPTKLDMTRRFGGLLTAAHSTKLAFMAAGTSPHIVDGLSPINPVSLARLLLPTRLEHQQHTLATGTR
ncbi:GTP-binding protein [Kiloniella laminariae]|uniref:GTP-binding protein n=1 Tax=Kiloniella laminariae TaxID=454162 RepID=A0ABT4LHX7_9PROT|nr:GTP-binding protein [Kiloniella laminariae]MCZ4280530.1 GTP-binding protein [Kiloniella laminariae]